MSEGGLEKSAWALTGKLLTGGLGLGAVGGAGLYGYNKVRDGIRNHNRQSWGDVPMRGPYNQATAATKAKDMLSNASKGVAAVNSAAEKEGIRIAELQSAYDAGGPDSAAALAELQRIRSAPAAAQRATYQKELDQYHTGVSSGLGTVQQDLTDLNASRNTLWSKTRNFFGFPRDFDGEERVLAEQRQRLSEQATLAQRMSQRLRSGATSFSDGPMTHEQLQRDFFPTKP
jgi:hypothetical protein